MWPVKGGGPRIKITGANTLGSVKTATVYPRTITYSNIQWMRQIGSGSPVVWGNPAMIPGANEVTYALTASDIPAPGSGQAIRVFVMVDGPSVMSDYSTLYS